MFRPQVLIDDGGDEEGNHPEPHSALTNENPAERGRCAGLSNVIVNTFNATSSSFTRHLSIVHNHADSETAIYLPYKNLENPSRISTAI